MLVPLVSEVVSGFEFSNECSLLRGACRLAPRPPRVAAVTGGVNPCPDLPLSRAPQRLPALGRNKHTQNSTVVQF
ncbi:hypothetical protein CT19431_120043 [Cupriavidus taiwanensis]|nr:hypothetical protein CT19431_120043 [Cupriavidus taiwanensis]